MRTLFQLACIALSCASISACGGGGGGGGETPAADTTPNAFSFSDKTDVDLDSQVSSSPVNITGISGPSPVSIENGEYSINGGPFTSVGGSVQNDTDIVVRVMSSSDVSATTSATLTVGGVSDKFDVTTLVDSSAPSASVVFPPVASMTDGGTVTVRGTASDDLTAITSLRVNGVDAQTTDNFATWFATVPLTAGNNNLLVEVSDNAGNINNNATSVSIFATDAMLTFSRGIAVDPDNNRALVADMDVDAIVAVDLDTGARSILSNSSSPKIGDINGLNLPTDLTIDSARNRALITDLGVPDILAADLDTGALSLAFVSAPFGAPVDITIDEDNNQALVIYQRTDVVVAYDLDTGEQTVITDADSPGERLTNPTGVVVDGNRALVTTNPAPGEEGPGKIVAVDLASGERTLFYTSDTFSPPHLQRIVDLVIQGPRALVLVGSDAVGFIILSVELASGNGSLYTFNGTHEGDADFQWITDLAVDSANGRLLTVDTGRQTEQVIAVDLASRSRSLLSADESTVNSLGERMNEPFSIAMDAARDRLLVADRADIGAEPGGDNLKIADRYTGEYQVLADGHHLNDIIVDEAGNRALVATTWGQVWSRDLDSGAQSQISSGEIGVQLAGLQFDTANNQIFMVDSVDTKLLRVDIATGSAQVVSDNVTPNADNPFGFPNDIALDLPNNRAFVSDERPARILLVDLADGARTVFPTTGEQETQIIAPVDIHLDTPNNRLLVADSGKNMIVAVDLATGSRSVISSGTMPNGNNVFAYPTQILVDPSEPTRAWVSDRGLNAILMVDLVTGERVVSSR